MPDRRESSVFSSSDLLALCSKPTARACFALVFKLDHLEKYKLSLSLYFVFEKRLVSEAV